MNGIDKISDSITAIIGNYKPDLPVPMAPKTHKPDILIGMAGFWKFYRNIQRVDGDIYGVWTTFGPLFCGRREMQTFHGKSSRNTSTTTTAMSVVEDSFTESPAESDSVKRFWDLETLGIQDDPAQDDDAIAMQMFLDSLKLVEGRYQVAWPWKEQIPDLPSNFGLAYHRLVSNCRSLQSRPELRWNRSISCWSEVWAKWKENYLLLIRDHSGWHHDGPRSKHHRPPRLGEVVLVEEDNPRLFWRTGVIVGLPANQKIIRSAQIRMPNGRVLTRPVSRIYPLELPATEEPTLPEEGEVAVTAPVEDLPVVEIAPRHKYNLRSRATTSVSVVLTLLVHVHRHDIVPSSGHSKHWPVCRLPNRLHLEGSPPGSLRSRNESRNLLPGLELFL